MIAGRLRRPQVAGNYTIPWPEPDDHALGRSRGGFTTKIHALVDHRMRPVVVRLTAGQAGDNPQLVPLLNDWAQQRPSGGRRRAGSGSWPTRPTPTPPRIPPMANPQRRLTDDPKPHHPRGLSRAVRNAQPASAVRTMSACC